MRKKNWFLICFIGIDGSGKTTLTKKLKEELARNGIAAVYVMGRFESFQILKPFRWVVKRTILRGKRTDHSSEGIQTKKRLFSNRLVAGIWQWALILDYFFQLFFKIRLPLLLGKSICADRYVYDTVVDLAVDTALPAARMQKLLTWLRRLTPGPDVVFLIDLPEAIAYERNLIKHDNITLAYLKARRSLYLAFGKRPEVAVMDGSRQPEELFQEITGKLKARGILP